MTSATIIAVGTEITDGQITNSNSQWLSQKLQDLNIDVSLHLSAPDTPLLIHKTLELATEQTDLIFVCGGLGPTSDDLTRNVISDFLKLPLELSASAWIEVQEKLQSRNVIVRETHQQQCLFPKTAKVLSNTAGLAPGFYMQQQTKHYWVLPGPPHEIESIWENGVEQQLRSQFSQTKHLQLTTWLCLGVPESELAHTTEKFFKEYTFEKKLGYRLQVPYVEIKLWHDPNNSEAQLAVTEFKKQLGSFYVDSSLLLINKSIETLLKKQVPVLIQDASSSGLLLNRLTQALGSPLWEHGFQYHLGATSSEPLRETNILQVSTHEQNWLCEWRAHGKKSNWEVVSPSNKKSKWREPFLVEKLILEWLKELR
jgi:nicotinamide-nucleotide amidase